MKRILLLCALFTLTLITKLNAQCGIGIPNVTNVVTGSSTDSCFITFDLSFSMKNNGGNKIIGIDFWQNALYPSTPPSYAKVPSPTELANSLGSIMIDNTANGSPINVTFLPTYPSGSSVRLLAHGIGSRTYVQAVDSFYFNLTKIKVAAAKSSDGSCPVSLLTLKGNVWSTNSGSYNANTSIQCYSSISFSLGNPTIPSASANCASKTLKFTVATSSSTDITVTYKIFKDDNAIVGGIPVFNTATDPEVTPTGTQAVILNSTNSYSSPDISYPDNGYAYWVVVYYTGLDGQTYSVSRLTNGCPAPITLPVSFQSFSATRSNQSVSVKWQTASEQNNRGFYVQRNVNGEWKDIAFVFTKADGGNSNEPLSYSYNDPNPLSSVSYYRVLQVDLDGRGKLSDIRIVKGLAEVSKLLMFPNPGSNGKINLLFQDEVAPKNVLIYDATGRAVKSFKNVLSANLTVDQLKPGVYSIQVINTTSQVVTSDKFIIKD
jgi:hypothetical protein